jgi:hypothetical protein
MDRPVLFDKSLQQPRARLRAREGAGFCVTVGNATLGDRNADYGSALAF